MNIINSIYLLFTYVELVNLNEKEINKNWLNWIKSEINKIYNKYFLFIYSSLLLNLII